MHAGRAGRRAGRPGPPAGGAGRRRGRRRRPLRGLAQPDRALVRVLDHAGRAGRPHRDHPAGLLRRADPAASAGHAGPAGDHRRPRLRRPARGRARRRPGRRPVVPDGRAAHLVRRRAGRPGSASTPSWSGCYWPRTAPPARRRTRGASTRWTTPGWRPARCSGRARRSRWPPTRRGCSGTRSGTPTPGTRCPSPPAWTPSWPRRPTGWPGSAGCARRPAATRPRCAARTRCSTRAPGPTAAASPTTSGRSSLVEIARRAVGLGFTELVLYFPADPAQRPAFEAVCADVLPERRRASPEWLPTDR